MELPCFCPPKVENISISQPREEIIVKPKNKTFNIENCSVLFDIIGTCLSPIDHDVLEKLAECEITSNELEGPGSPNDMRLGVIDKNVYCPVCKQDGLTCPGHVGIIRLNHWYINPKFIKPALEVATIFCNSCGECLIQDSLCRILGYYQMSPSVRLNTMAKMCKKRRCRNKKCPPNPEYVAPKTKDSHIVVCKYMNPNDSSKTIDIELDIKDLYDFYCHLKQENLRKIGFINTHPKNFILRSLAVMPSCARPYVILNGSRKEDHLTIAYKDIARYNNMLHPENSHLMSSEVQRKKTIRDLYFFIYHMIDNSDGKYSQTRDEMVQGIVNRMTQKTGFIRGTSMGKRVDFSSRTILNPSNEIPYTYVKAPSDMKINQTVPIKVCLFNINKLTQMYKNKEILYIIIGNGQNKGKRFSIIDNVRKRYLPQIGDTVGRIGVNGDEILFGRQPTLNKYSLIGYFITYEDDYKCFGIHSSATTPHNADHDGDEGTIHKIQTLEARAETKFVANCGLNILSGQNSRPIIGLVYNCIVSAYVMTNEKIKQLEITDLLWEEAFSLLINKIDANDFFERLERQKISKKSGKALISLIFPSDFYYKSGQLLIKNGILIKGFLNKTHLGPNDNSVLHYIVKQYGMTKGKEFITNGQRILDLYISKRGFSISLKDCIPSDPKLAKAIIDKEIQKASNKINVLIKNRPSSLIETNLIEQQIQNQLNVISRIGKQIANNVLTENNPLNVMCISGAKGNDSNMAQIVGCLGQQYVKGQRPEKMLTNTSRCLVYFEPNSDEISSTGFIKSSFLTGCSPSEWFFHLLCSRIGLMDTALKTATTGYMHRKIVKALESIIYDNNGTVKDTNGMILQFSYGSGFDVSQLIKCENYIGEKFHSFIDIKHTIGYLNSLH